jgi:hypothetical protein
MKITIIALTFFTIINLLESRRRLQKSDLVYLTEKCPEYELEIVTQNPLLFKIEGICVFNDECDELCWRKVKSMECVEMLEGELKNKFVEALYEQSGTCEEICNRQKMVQKFESCAKTSDGIVCRWKNIVQKLDDYCSNDDKTFFWQIVSGDCDKDKEVFGKELDKYLETRNTSK